jgi:hypothetical protein
MPEREHDPREEYANWKAPDNDEEARAERHAKADVEARNAGMYPDYHQSPREKPFTETGDESERQARYRMIAYDALDNVRAITNEADGLDDSQTRIHLEALRNELERLDLDHTKARLQ